jgi:hypothetical protein
MVLINRPSISKVCIKVASSQNTKHGFAVHCSITPTKVIFIVLTFVNVFVVRTCSFFVLGRCGLVCCC